MSALREYSTNSMIVEKGCIAVYNLSSRPEVRVKLINAGVKSVLEGIESMEELGDDARVEARDALARLNNS